MAIKKFKPVTPGARFRSTLGNEEITRSKPERSLVESLKSNGGRNHHGVNCPVIKNASQI